MKITRKSIFIVGAQKAGTTGLYNTLIQNPIFDIPKFKEPQFLSLKKEIVRDNFHWYDGLYKNTTGSVLIDASTSYLSSSWACEHIKEFFQEPYILITLRDPAKRSFSAYQHMLRKAPALEKRSFDTIINDIKDSPFERLTDSEHESLRRAVEARLIKKDYYGINYLRDYWNGTFDSVYKDPMWAYRYFQESVYSRRIQSYQDFFPERVKLIFFEEFIRHPAEILENIYNFLKLPLHRSYLSTSSKVYTTRVPKSAMAKWFLDYRADNPLASHVIRGLKFLGFNQAIANVKSMLFYKPRLTYKQYKDVRAILANEYEYWFAQHSKLKELWKF